MHGHLLLLGALLAPIVAHRILAGSGWKYVAIGFFIGTVLDSLAHDAQKSRTPKENA